jgi:methylase of polypeptide subunit release factors
MPDNDIRIHEVTFCSRVSKWADSLFAEHPDWPFKRTEIEESKGIKKKRSDLRVYGAGKKLILAGEVKLPGTPEGRNAYNSALVDDSHQKASNMGAEFFFTWNVNKLVLFDSKLWHLPLMERRVKDYDLGLDLDTPEDVSRAEVEKRIQEFLANFFSDFATIATGEQPDWGMPPDKFFIRAFESHISWPVKLTAEFLWAKSASSKPFDSLLQEWMAADQGWAVIRNDPKTWRTLVDRAARTLCYVFANRLLFYESIRTKFDELKELHVPSKATSADDLYLHFQKAFQLAVDATGDYETLFYPAEKDWAGPHIFGHEHSLDAWRSVLENLRPFNFKAIRTDILGGIFRRLIEPEERHKFGQHYTNEDLVDVVNAFCIRKAEDAVLDPACGSGSFVVRAYHRKAWLDRDRRLTHPAVSHQDRLAQIYGADISLFAAHLSTLNLAAREINDEENYPRIARRNFFEVRAGKPFCELPQGLRGEKKRVPIVLPPLNAVVGNPPYVRQELIPRRNDKPKPKAMQAKEDLLELCADLWPGLQLSGRSDLHCYFWPAAAHLLTEGGWFGFLVSSSWLDVEYGFALQEWLLTNFKIHALLESNAEPWFADARVKTCAVILQRCADPAKRDANLVKFVRLDTPLAEILGERKDENARQTAAERFRAEILACKSNATRAGWRVVVKKQKDLWEDGLRAGKLFALQKQRDLADGIASASAGEDANVEGQDSAAYDENGNGLLHEGGGIGYGSKYGGGKWGKYLRAPNLYFQIMNRYGSRFVPLGEIATIRFGVKSGCDAFFMPRDVSAEFLQKYSPLEWNDAPLHTHCKRSEVESGEVKLVKTGSGDDTVHPVEAKYLSPEVHSLMNVSRPVLTPSDLSRIVLLVSEPMHALKGTYVQKYLRYGERNTFASTKSKAVPVPERATCASRNLWYDLTYTKCGHLVWPKSQQYRHVVVHNKSRVVVNCNLYDVTVIDENKCPPELLAGVLNSTLVGLVKIYFGRYAGTEGNLKTEVVDVNLLEVPDPRHITKTVANKLQNAFHQLCTRDTQPMVEEEFMERQSAKHIKKLAEKPIGLPQELKMPDRRALDLAVFELLGVTDAAEREKLCDELYYETANHFRQIRIVEVQKQEQRAGAEGREFRTDELAADLWDSLPEEDKQPIAQWITSQATGGAAVNIPEGHASLPDANDFLDANTVFFRHSDGGKAVSQPLHLPSRAHAETVYLLSQHGIHGSLLLPAAVQAAQTLQQQIVKRLAAFAAKAGELARSRTGDEKRLADLARLLEFWMTHGKPRREPQQTEAQEP